MSKTNNKRRQSRFFCTNCGKEGMPIQRKIGQEREARTFKKIILYLLSERNKSCGNPWNRRI